VPIVSTWNVIVGLAVWIVASVVIGLLLGRYLHSREPECRP
jgi:hypothetical protein